MVPSSLARAVAWTLVLVTVNAAYLAWRDDATLLYFGNVALHLVLGLALGSLAVVAVVRRAVAWRHWPGTSVVSALALATGLVLIGTGTTRPFRPLLYAHVAFSLVATALLVRALARLLLPRRATLPVVAAVCVLLAVPAVALTWAAFDTGPKIVIRNPTVVPVSMDGEGQGPNGPFFPSSVETNTGGKIPSNFFMKSEECARCHKEIFEQWSSSAHHLSSFNNQWYRKSVEYMQDVVGTRPSTWCAGCHDHALLFDGSFDRPVKEQLGRPEAHAGLGCVSCHSIVHVKSTMGQGDFTIEYPPLHDLATSDQPLLRAAHDYALRLDPAPHRKAFLKDVHKQSAEFCSSCHKVHLDVPVNAYRWLRGFNEYDNWQASGVSGQGARSFYYPKSPMNCASCHMPLVEAKDPAARNGRVHSHRFPGANTALPFVNGDEEQLRVVQEFLRDNQVSVDVFGLVRGGGIGAGVPSGARGAEPRLATTFAVGEESMGMGAAGAGTGPAPTVLAPLDIVDPVVRRGESVRLEVVVRTRKVGHFFPGGTVDAFDVWVELEGRDEVGRVVFHSGSVADGGRGPVEPGAHFYRSVMLDDHGNRIDKRNAWAARSVAYVRLIPPGAADTVHYRFDVPSDCGERVTFTARVNYRKFGWWNTQWSYAGVRDPAHIGFSLGPGHDDGRWVFTGETTGVSGALKSVPSLPTTVLAERQVVLRVAPHGAPVVEDAPRLTKESRERFNDYGIGLLLQGDLKAAEAAFTNVTSIDPGYADGHVNVARARLQEGDLAGASEELTQALRLSPRLASARFFMGLADKQLGQYDEGIANLQVAEAQYPRDRVVLNQLGRLHFLKREHEKALTLLRRVLEIDPEDVTAHYNMMLAYQGLGDSVSAGRERRLYERFKADESAQAITGRFRQLHPEDNNERQQVHEHVTAAPSSGTPYATDGAARRSSDASAASSPGRAVPRRAVVSGAGR